MCVLGGKKNSFFGKFGVFCFLEIPVVRFALLPYYRRYTMSDYCSQGTVMSADLTKKLKTDGMKTTIKIKSLNGGHENLKQSVGLKIWKTVGKPVWTDLRVTYSIKHGSVRGEQVATEWKY